MKSLMSLWRELANESASWCGTSTLRDYQTVTERVKAEGESFLTITLTQFGHDFFKALDNGSVDSSLFLGFKKRAGLPVFLQGFLSQVFDTSGTLLPTPSIDCIRSVRQLTLMFGKIERKCTPVREARAMRRYVEVEAELKEIDTSSFEEFLPLFQKASTLLWADVFADVENDIIRDSQSVLISEALDSYLGNEESFGNQAARVEDPFLAILNVRPAKVGQKSVSEIVNPAGFQIQPVVGNAGRPYNLVPRHGPGATADRLRGNAKFDLVVWPQRLERVFPYGEYALPSWRYYYQLDRVQLLEPGKETPVKVVAVPKTLKTPRIIAEEPTAMQYMQQALSNKLVHRLQNHLEGRTVLTKVSRTQKVCDLGKHFVGFALQEPNRLLACEGSHDGRLATLDLSEASDRVLNQHVELLFSRFPRLSEAIQATRSSKADVPGQGIISLAKFASMGSALCFPVEAMVFTTIIFTAIAHERQVPLTRGLIESLRGKVRVYGDDIIVPVEYVQPVIRLLELFGLKVNLDKSYWNGKFRESCGGDYYDGEWVTPIRLKHDLPQSLADVSGVVGLTAFRNLLYWSGYWKTASVIDNHLRRLLRGHWSIVESTSAGLGRQSVLNYVEDSQHPNLHVPLVKGAIVKYRTPKSSISGVGALQKFGLKQGLVPSQDPRHLERQGRPEASRIKLRGIRPY